MDALFGLVTLLPGPVWVAMLLFPRHPFTRRLVTSPWPFLVLGGAYGGLLAAAWVTSPATALSMPAWQAAMTADVGFLAVWAHLRMADLFAGVWLFRDAKYWNVNVGPYLMAAVFVAPLAVGAYLWARRRWARADPARRVN